MLDRREFFKTLGGLLVVFTFEEDAFGQRGGERLPQELEAWLHIGKDGVVTACTGKVEVGQGSRTELTQAVAEELRASLSSIRLLMGDTDLTPFDMGTFGSRTTPTMVPVLRRAAATAREALLDLAAERWHTGRGTLTAAGGKVTNPATGASLGYGELTQGQKLVKTLSESAPLTPVPQWRIAGTSVPKVDAREIVTGRHKYTPDMKLAGMLHGKVLRPSSFGARLVSLDGSRAEAIAGVKVVREGDFAGVVAPDPQLAARAVTLLRAEWKEMPQPSGAELFDYLKKNQESGRNEAERGSVEKALAEAPLRLSQIYTVAYIAHAPLEPRAALASWSDGKLTVWTGSQRPFGVHGELVQAFGVAADRVRVIVPDTGGAYGGKHSGEAAVEAARLAKASGKPVKLVWTREEEFTWAYFRPAGVIEIASGMTRDGRITAWQFTNINSGPAGLQIAYDIPNHRIAFHPSKPALRQGSYRALAATANHFARETHINELAHAAGLDPLEFRLKNTQDARFRAVLQAAAERFGWGKSKAGDGRGMGIAAGWEKGSYVATCAEATVEQPGGRVVVNRVVQAFECGAVVNPDNMKNQCEGAVMMGLGGALFEAIQFDNGRILNPRFSRYRVPRFGDAPAIEIVLVDRKDLPSAGGGETPIVGIAPALGEAIFTATGVRLRSLPLAPKGVTT